jgi:hypothetical protein
MTNFENFNNISYSGPEIDDFETFDLLPDYLKDFFLKKNGFIIRTGIFHIRGCVKEPKWHSLKEIWLGENKLSNLFQSINKNDIPIAQNCLGDQFFLRHNIIHLLKSEYDEVENLKIDFIQFIEEMNELAPEEIDVRKMQNIILEPGQLINSDPPLALKSPIGYSFKAIDAIEQIKNLSKLSRLLKKGIDKDLISLNPN